jgi:hypothetical protein
MAGGPDWRADANDPMQWAMTNLDLSQDAAIVLGLGGTSIPYAATLEDEAERWLRVLRLHGQVGSVLQKLGVGEAPLETPARPPRTPRLRNRPDGRDVMEVIADRAKVYANGRGSRLIATVDILFSVFEAYGGLFDRALYLHGTSREELMEHLAEPVAAIY